MSERDLVPLGAAVLADVLSSLQLPGGASLVEIMSAYTRRKRREASDMLITELSHGHHGTIRFEEYDVDPLIEIVHRFSKAVNDGAARENLRLLAQIIAGLKKNKALEADKFRKWSGILEGLTRDELMLLGKGIAVQRDLAAGGPYERNEFWQRLRPMLLEGGYSQDDISALCGSIGRTGLIIFESAFGGGTYTPTSWLSELGELADFESVFAQPSG